ncbi:molybdenum cofactor guanylyltransferase [Pusillimonas sp. ANT_WB101]|uniref:molybdenum cofactor guanylyltransferase n=1 Tax=Pusillimonas sp. ANT_WB101 TaxID=2597356 RepID=UPI0011EC0AE3|nr:molybdenum cofactor guanylyltransferase [Pusillimonas sp. ANT_WB101]KAA0890101.1 molybdenum cofactor guanylyltransferase [Pusillimonas sp. ANT_WB101]
MIPREHLTGLILAGGRASRMQPTVAGSAPSGRLVRHGPRGGLSPEMPAANSGIVPIEKGLALLHDEPLVAHARRFLQGQVSRVVISANRSVDAFARYGEVITDDAEIGPDAGPLAGIYSALVRIDTPWLVVTPVDVINPPEDLVPRLADAIARKVAQAAYATTTRSHPLCMMVHADLAPSLRSYLLGGDRKVMLWLERIGAVSAPFDMGEHAFANINTLADLQHAQIRGAADTV